MPKRTPYKAEVLNTFLAWHGLTKCERKALGLPTSERAFAGAHGITPRTLHRWRQRFVHQDPSHSPASPAGQQEARL